jgi:hypothetical protein
MGGSASDEVLVEYLGEWHPATVLWRYTESGRSRALVRFETTAGLVVRQLRWVDDRRPSGREMVIGLRRLQERDRPTEA